MSKNEKLMINILDNMESGKIKFNYQNYDDFREYCLNIDKNDNNKNRKKKLMRWYILIHKKAKQGKRQAQYRLGWIYEHGFGVEQDIDLALLWYKKAAKKNYNEAQCGLARLYYEWGNTTKQKAKAIKVYNEIFDSEPSSTLKNVNGYFVKIKYTCEYSESGLSLDFLCEMAEKGFACAQYIIGTKYHIGELMPYGLAEIQQDNNLAAKWILMAAEQGHVDAQYLAGWFYLNGYGVETNGSIAAEWFNKSANNGSVEAQNNLGRQYQLGQGVEMDGSLAEKWLLKAAEQNLDVAFLNLGELYEKGKNGGAPDYALAIDYYEKAAESDMCFKAMINLGRMYELGVGVPQDYYQAFQWYQDASEQDYCPEGIFNLARLYAQGKGVKQNNTIAFDLLKDAALEYDYVPARHVLGKILIEDRGTENKAYAEDFVQMES